MQGFTLIMMIIKCLNYEYLLAHSFVIIEKHKLALGRGGGTVVNMLAFYSDNLSSNPAKVYNFDGVKIAFKRTKINRKRGGNCP